MWWNPTPSPADWLVVLAVAIAVGGVLVLSAVAMLEGRTLRRTRASRSGRQHMDASSGGAS